MAFSIPPFLSLSISLCPSLFCRFSLHLSFFIYIVLLITEGNLIVFSHTRKHVAFGESSSGPLTKKVSNTKTCSHLVCRPHCSGAVATTGDPCTILLFTGSQCKPSVTRVVWGGICLPQGPTLASSAAAVTSLTKFVDLYKCVYIYVHTYSWIEFISTL